MLKVHTYPDEVLGAKAKPVKRIDTDLLKLIDRMFETMYAEQGVGLAAPQIGESVRLCVLNCTGKKEGERVLINPVIVERSGEHTDEEGCLSVPGARAKVTRAEKVKVRAYDRRGEEIELEADGLLARCIQHELDHLSGRLFFQRLNEAARMTLNSRLKQLEDEHEEGPESA